MFSPMQMIQQQMQQQNPQLFNKIMEMTNGKSPEQIQQMVQNMAKERGIDISQFDPSKFDIGKFAQNFGFKL